MKKLELFFCLCICFNPASAQRFFYIAQNGTTDNLVRNSLSKASQFITSSPLSSDYIINTEVNFESGGNILTVQINLQDTATLQTVFQGKETVAFGEFHASPRIMLYTVIQAFIDKNISQFILSATDNHFYDQSKMLRIRKDKT